MTSSSLAPAFWVMGTSVAGFIAVCFLKESARKPLPGSLPSVATEEEAIELVKTQEENPDLDVEELFEQVPALEESYQLELTEQGKSGKDLSAQP